MQCTCGIAENTRGQRVTKCAHFLVLNLKCFVNISNRSGKRREVCKLKCFEAVCIFVNNATEIFFLAV